MLTKEIALQFALMVNSGMPPLEALAYFFPDLDPQTLAEQLRVWTRDPQYQEATLTLQGKAWQKMSLDERMKYSVDKHYAECAYFLYSHNYATLMGSDKQKADTCRVVLETRMAGNAGKNDPMSKWIADIASGSVKLPALPMKGH